MSELKNIREQAESKGELNLGHVMYLLDKIDADAKLLADGREMFTAIFEKAYLKWCPYCSKDQPIGGGNEHESYCELNEWLKPVADG